MSEPMEMPDLLPCPFCGGKAERGKAHTGGWVDGSYIFCTQCHTKTQEFRGGPLFEYRPGMFHHLHHMLAARAWNIRAGDLGTLACPECGVAVPHAHHHNERQELVVILAALRSAATSGKGSITRPLEGSGKP
jgi:hypothetical protein